MLHSWQIRVILLEDLYSEQRELFHSTPRDDLGCTYLTVRRLGGSTAGQGRKLSPTFILITLRVLTPEHSYSKMISWRILSPSGVLSPISTTGLDDSKVVYRIWGRNIQYYIRWPIPGGFTTTLGVLDSLLLARG